MWAHLSKKEREREKRRLAIYKSASILGTSFVLMGALSTKTVGENMNFMEYGVEAMPLPIHMVEEHKVEEKHSDILDTISMQAESPVTLLYQKTEEANPIATIKSNYGAMIAEMSMRFGIDEELICAVIAQESRGTASNLMQIEANHIGHPHTAFDKKEGRVITVVPTESMLNNPYDSILLGVIILRNCSDDFKNNPWLTLQAYNFGSNGMKTVLKIYAEEHHMTVDEVMEDPYNLEWFPYREYYRKYFGEKAGDLNYVENVMQWYQGDSIILEETPKTPARTVSFEMKLEKEATL